MTRADWFAVARRLLVAHGGAALTVEELTTRAGVTKGSFYHHFQGQQGFVEAFLADVRHRAFADVVADVDAAAPPREHLGQLATAISGHTPALERALRRWAATSPAVAAVVAQVDRDRLAYVRGLFVRVTGDDRAAELLARLHLAFYVGCLHVDPPVHGAEFLEMVARMEQLLPREQEHRP